MRNLLSVSILVTAMVSPLAAAPEQPDAQVANLKTLSLEELLQIDVTTVSRESERRIDAPAAVSVITGEDIRRYGVDTLADVLRLADSVSVARFNGSSWAIATRGFSATTNNKMLVMIDGRSVYTPLFGGVFWEVQHVPLPDVDRIEIIRGPAGILWGPNAVNGVINVITKRTSETQGVFVRGVTGSRERGHVIARYGGTLNAGTTYRLYGVGSQFDSPQLQDGSSANEDRRLRQAGGRVDWAMDDQTHLSVQGDVNSGRMGLADRPDIQMDGGNVVVNFSKPFRGESFQVLGYVDREHRDVPQQSWESRTTYNVETQQGVRLAPRYRLLVGAGVRSTLSDTQRTALFFFDPDDRRINQVHGFAQTDITITPKVSATVGTRAERTTFSGFDLQPAVRAKYTPRADAMIWGAISRAIRTPTRFDQDLRITIGDTVVIRGDRGFKPEKLTAFESGARFSPRTNVSFEASVFHNDYDDLRSQEATPLITLANLYDGYVTGVELAGNVQPHSRWLVHASYTGQRVALKPLPESRDRTNARAEADDPSHAFSMRSYLNLPHNFELDGFFRAIGKLRASNLPGYQELDMRVGWQATDRLELSLIGRELLHPRHTEFMSASSPPRYFEREVAFRVTFQIE